jgi:hypothetical protein
MQTMTAMNIPVQNPRSSISNAYTDAPDLHPNLVLGSLHLLFWLLFHRRAWRGYVTRIDPSLNSGFALVDLKDAHWREPELWRLFLRSHLVLPTLTGLLVGLGLWLTGQPRDQILHGLLFGFTLSVAFGMPISTGISLGGGMAGGVAFGLMGGIALGIGTFGVVLSVAGHVILGGAEGVAASGIIVGIAGGVAGQVTANALGRGKLFSLARRVGGVFVGILIGVLTVSIARIIATIVADLLRNGLVFGITFGMVFGVASGMIVAWRAKRRQLGIIFGIIGGLGIGLILGITIVTVDPTILRYFLDAIAIGTLCGAMFILPFALSNRLAGHWAGAVAGALGSSGGLVALIAGRPQLFWSTLLLCTIGVLFSITITFWRPILLYPLIAAYNLVLYRLDLRRGADRLALLRYHSAFWDEHQRLPLVGLEDHIVLVAERSPAEGRAAIEYLSTSRQRWAAQAAQIELDARWLEHCIDAAAIGGAYRDLAAGELEGPASALLRSFSRISADVDAALRQESAYNQRLALSAVEDRLDGLLRELTRSSDRYAVRFRPIATRWRGIIAERVRALAAAAEQRQEIDSPYIIGVPLTEQQEIFVGRADISARIEQLLLDRRRPPLLLYGQRRMGKTSLLNNLGRLLPSTIVPLFVDLQGPAANADDHAGLLYNLARGMAASAERQRGLALPPLPREALAVDPFTRFDEWIDAVERALEPLSALLTLDEFEALDSAIDKGRFDEERVLGMLRNLIQHRPRFKVLLAGSHTLDELQRWASYLINVQVVQIGYLKQDEARQLIERPVEGFALRYEPQAGRRALDLTRGHPFLTQLLCAEVVALKNEQEPAARRLARLEDIEAAVPAALQSGSFFFADIQRNQVDDQGRALLRFVAAQGPGATVARADLARQIDGAPDITLDLLTRRELIEPVDGGFRFQVELLRRWFAGS